MTESEWNTSTDPTAMLEFLRGKVGDRKLRLFAVACCRAIWWQLEEYRGYQEIVETLELVADEALTRADLDRAIEAAETFVSSFGPVRTVTRACQLDAWSGARQTSFFAGIGLHLPSNLLRCVFNPFHPITLDPSWLTSTVVSLAQQMYDSRDFSAMPILADALQDSSCDNETILTHCRGLGPHTRGCWLVDLLTNRE